MRRWVLLVLLVAFGASLAGPAAAGGPVWGKDLVKGKDFPLPFGIGVTYFSQDQDYKIDKLTLGIPGFPPIPTETLKIKNSIDEVNAKFDVWLLPFLNVFGIGGHLNGDTRVDLSALPVQLGLPFTQLRFSYDGEVYGIGAVLAGGTDRFFGSLTGIYTNTQLSGNFDSSVSADILTPRVGVYNRVGALYVGAMYQHAQEKHKGTIPLPFLGLVPFSVELSQKDDWNWVAGGSWAFRPDWSLELEGGFGDRTHVDAAVTWRF